MRIPQSRQLLTFLEIKVEGEKQTKGSPDQFSNQFSKVQCIHLKHSREENSGYELMISSKMGMGDLTLYLATGWDSKGFRDLYWSGVDSFCSV